MSQDSNAPVIAPSGGSVSSSPRPSIVAESRGGPRPTPGTLTQLFLDTAKKYDKPNTLQVKVQGHYQPISHRTVLERVRRVALGLQ